MSTWYSARFAKSVHLTRHDDNGERETKTFQPSFPRSAWECLCGRSASRVATGQYARLRDAERPGLHSHAERGNEGAIPRGLRRPCPAEASTSSSRAIGAGDTGVQGFSLGWVTPRLKPWTPGVPHAVPSHQGTRKQKSSLTKAQRHKEERE